MQTRQWLIPRRQRPPGIFSLFPAYTGASQVMRKRDRSMDVITPLHPQKRLRHLHVIARSGAAAPRRGNPFSLQWHITKRNTLGKSAAVYEFALNAAYFPLSLRGYGLPRRFAPRNDIHKLATLHHIRNGASPILSGSLLLSADSFAILNIICQGRARCFLLSAGAVIRQSTAFGGYPRYTTNGEAAESAVSPRAYGGGKKSIWTPRFPKMP